MKYKIGDKVWVEYAYDIYKGRVIAVLEDDEYFVKFGFSHKMRRPECMLSLRRKR